MKVINLIAGPRNLSTAIMYAFAQMKGMQVLDEPFYGYYLKNADVKISHPAEREVIESMEVMLDTILARIEDLSQDSNVFLKGMAHHYLMEQSEFILDWENVLLIRRPEKLILSFSKVIPNPSLDDIGLKKSAEIFRYLSENGKTPIVIDSDELLINPEAYLRKLCEKLNLSFTENMLHWEKGGNPEDGIWAEHWYKNLHNSDGFITRKRRNAVVPSHLESLLKEAMPYYEILKDKVLLNR